MPLCSICSALFPHGLKSVEVVTLRSRKQHEIPIWSPRDGPCRAQDPASPSPMVGLGTRGCHLLHLRLLTHHALQGGTGAWQRGLDVGIHCSERCPRGWGCFRTGRFFLPPLPLCTPLGDPSHMVPAPLRGKTVLPPQSSLRAQEHFCWCHFEEKVCGGGSRDSAGGNSAEDAGLGPRQRILPPAPVCCLLRAGAFCLLELGVSCCWFGVY